MAPAFEIVRSVALSRRADASVPVHATVGAFATDSKRVLQREKGKGWRLDTFVVSERLMPRVVACEIRWAPLPDLVRLPHSASVTY